MTIPDSNVSKQIAHSSGKLFCRTSSKKEGSSSDFFSPGVGVGTVIVVGTVEVGTGGANEWH